MFERLARAGSSRGLVVVIAGFIASRGIYAYGFGIRFDDSSLLNYMQYVDPALLRASLIESIYYLREQPPVFNLYLGLVLKLFPTRSHEVFATVAFALGLVLTASTYLLMVRMKVGWLLAALTAIVFSTAPTTLLYENWLFYTYPVATLMVTAALFLHRFLDGHGSGDAIAFFWLLGAIVLIRGIFHLVWLLAITGALLFFCNRNRLAIATAAVVPLLLVVTFHVKTYLVFGSLVSGRMYQQINLAGMTVSRLPKEVRDQLIDAGRISWLSTVGVGDTTPLEVFEPYLPKRRPTGVPMLDQPKKSTGYTNWHHASTAEIGSIYGRDGLYVLKKYPGTYLRSVLRNIEDYFLPSSDTFPFGSDMSANGRRIRHLVRAHDLIVGGQVAAGGTAWALVLVFPACMLLVTVLVIQWLRRKWPIEEAPGALTALFAGFNVFYVSAVTILFSLGGQSRYRFVVAPLYCVLFAMVLTAGWNRRRSVVLLFAGRKPAAPARGTGLRS